MSTHICKPDYLPFVSSHDLSYIYYKSGNLMTRQLIVIYSYSFVISVWYCQCVYMAVCIQCKLHVLNCETVCYSARHLWLQNTGSGLRMCHTPFKCRNICRLDLFSSRIVDLGYVIYLLVKGVELFSFLFCRTRNIANVALDCNNTLFCIKI